MPFLNATWARRPHLHMNLLFRTGLGDMNCGMRALTKDAFGRMGLKADGMEFATEMIVKASLLGMSIAEVPCDLHKDLRDRPPHLRRWRDGCGICASCCSSRRREPSSCPGRSAWSWAGWGCSR